LKLDKPELRVEIDRDRAAAMGVEIEDIAAAVRLMVGGEERASRILRSVRQLQLRRADSATGRSAPRNRPGRQAFSFPNATVAWCGWIIW
jgi:multidrug efflux pump subunit AcrB